MKECCGKPLAWTKVSSDQQDDYSIEISCCDICKTVRHRKDGQTIYVQKNGSNFTCQRCGSDIMAAKVYHPTYEAPLPPGTTDPKIEIVPFCPKCEIQPARYSEKLAIMKDLRDH